MARKYDAAPPAFFLKCYRDPRALHSFPTRRSADRPPAGHERRRERLPGPTTAGGGADEHRSAGIEDSSDERARRNPVAADDHEPLTVTCDEREGVHAQAADERRAQPSQREVERRLVGERSLDRHQDLVAPPVAAGA